MCSFVLNALAVYEDAPEVWSLLGFIGFLVIGCVITTCSCFVWVMIVTTEGFKRVNCLYFVIFKEGICEVEVITVRTGPGT